MKAFHRTGLLFSKAVVCCIFVQLINCCQGQVIPTYQVFSGPASVTSLAYGNGTFVGWGGGFWFVSNNGSNWTAYANPPIINKGGVAFGNGVFMAFGTNIQDQNNCILQSTNGTAWTSIYKTPTTLTAAAYGNNRWVFLGTNGITTDYLVGNSNIWTEFQPPFSPTCITYGNGVFVIGAFFGNIYGILSSSDGINWQFNATLTENFVNYPIQFPVLGVAYGNGVFVATSPYQSYGGSFYTSTNLYNWIMRGEVNNSSGQPLTVAFGGNQFFVSMDSSGYASSDGFSWNYAGSIYLFSAIIYGQGTFVGSDILGNIYQSPIFAIETNAPPAMLGFSAYSGVTINGTAGAVYQIQTAKSLNSTWQTLTNFMLPYSPYLWIDTSTTVSGQKYYRSVQVQ